jgi:CRISPR system Cascade subunit CasB
VTDTPRLIFHLRQLAQREDRGALAVLRRGLRHPPGATPALYPHVVPYIPEADNRTGRDWPYFLVGSLFALHPVESGAAGDLGWTFRQMSDNPSSEHRFQALLDAHVDELHVHVRHAVSLARSAKRSVSVDYALLLGHLRHWTHPDRWVQRRWARSYWSPAGAPTTQADD